MGIVDDENRRKETIGNPERMSEHTQRPPEAGELLVISNRQPYTHRYTSDGAIEVSRPTGGLTAGLDPVMQRTDGTWIAWGDGEADEAVTDENGRIRMPPENDAYTLQRLWLTEEEVAGYYYGYSNRALWPLCHGAVEKMNVVDHLWQCYQQVNEKFADAVIERAEEQSLIWFQDYHFALAPEEVHTAVSDNTVIMQFWHIPWPDWETFRTSPHDQELLEGLLGNDLLGFHIQRYCENFLGCVKSLLDDAVIDRNGSCVQYDGHTTRVAAFPMGIDAEAIRQTTQSVNDEFWEEFRRKQGITPETQVVLGVDRLDYTKGIVKRLTALEQLWERRPKWRGDLTYVQKAVESRSLIPEYQILQENVRAAVERINNRFGTDDWQPVIYLDEWCPREELCGLYRSSDVMLVSAVCDGMNLVAKEYIAAQVEDDGVLVLSDQTGAHTQLGGHAITINPSDIDGFVEAIETALLMDDGERRERMNDLRHQVHSQGLDAWMDDIFATADALQHEQ